MHETGPFSIPAIRDFVPSKLRPWIIIAFVIVFQFSGGLYLAAVNGGHYDGRLCFYGGHGVDICHHVPPEVPFYFEGFVDDVQHCPDYF